MTGELWAFDDLVRASGGVADSTASRPITGFSIDTRSLVPGDVFVALKDQRDGHEFVSAAFNAGASAALVSDSYERKLGDGALIRVADTLRGLESIGRAARDRLAADAKVIAVTGSVGKTGTKEMLRACLSRLGETHAADKSFNNHWGVPLTLSRMPPATRFGVFEIGMNHAGEITPLVGMVRPHVAIVTTVEPVHLEFFASVAEIAEAKTEIFSGLVPGGVAIINRDNAHYERLARRASERGARIVTFGLAVAADVHPEALELGPEGSEVSVSLKGKRLTYKVGAAGAHLAQNSLAVLAAIDAAGLDAGLAAAALGGVRAPEGRGARFEIATAGGPILLIDESYNANPASMRAALAAMATVPRSRCPRRIAVLGDMLELGEESPRHHAELKEAVDAAGADLVFASGPNMAHLYQLVPELRRGGWAATSDGIRAALLGAVKPGDVIVIKGSLGSRMSVLVEAIKKEFGSGTKST